MKVKIKDQVYDSHLEPIMIILNETEKAQIGNMAQGITRYCSAPDYLPKEDIVNFMKI